MLSRFCLGRSNNNLIEFFLASCHSRVQYFLKVSTRKEVVRWSHTKKFEWFGAAVIRQLNWAELIHSRTANSLKCFEYCQWKFHWIFLHLEIIRPPQVKLCWKTTSMLFLLPSFWKKCQTFAGFSCWCYRILGRNGRPDSLPRLCRCPNVRIPKLLWFC